MGIKGEKRTDVARRVAQETADKLSSLGGVATRGMFGGYGLVRDGTMFGLVSSTGVVHFRVSDETRERYEAADASRHGSMPYFAVPAEVLTRRESLEEWAREALDSARSAQPERKKTRPKQGHETRKKKT